MSIEIDGLNSNRSPGADPSQGSSQAEGAGSQSPQPANPASADTVQLTDAAQQLARLESQIREQPVVDTQRVEQVRQAVNDGTYQVDARGVAQKLMQFEAYLPNA